jgi:two-component system CheB/CheR fusion protein
MPYRTHDNKIDGVVITFSDISLAKKLEAELRAAQARLTTRFTDQTAELGQANKELKAEIHHRTTTEAAEEAGKQTNSGVQQPSKVKKKKGKGG